MNRNVWRVEGHGRITAIVLEVRRALISLPHGLGVLTSTLRSVLFFGLSLRWRPLLHSCPLSKRSLCLPVRSFSHLFSHQLRVLLPVQNQPSIFHRLNAPP